MTIENLGVKLYSGLKQDRKSASLGSSADGTNTGITLVTATSTAEQTTGAEENTLNASDTRGMGEYVVNTSSTLYGKTLTDVQFNIKKATGGDTPAVGEVVRARHYNSSNTLIHTYWTKDATTLPTSFAWTSETTLSGDTAYAVGDYFVCEFTETDGTSPTGFVKINRKANGSGTKWDSTNSGFINTYFSASNWTDTNRDIQFKITLSDSIAENDYFTLRCLQTDNSARDFVFRTYATCSGDCQYSNSVLTAGYALNPVSSTWTYS
ncbi:MAG: hypothetical protein H8D84_02660 [Proteobacteria bacterium]|nr:hypothetical protein [Pseudomonadota bacterium]